MLRWLKTVVVSDEEKALVKASGGDRAGKASVSESSRTCHSERPPPSGPGGLCRDQASEFVTHLALALTRYTRHLRQDRLSVPPAIDELAAVLVHCARMRPAATRMDDEEPASQDNAVARRLLVTKVEAAEYLSVSVRTVERLVAAGQLPLLHIEGASRLRLEDVEAYVASLIPAESAQSSASGGRAGFRSR
jgi:excisionase family DNA binding protein